MPWSDRPLASSSTIIITVASSAEQIDSALSRNAPRFETIVVDDWSSDRSRSILEAYSDRVKVLFQKKHGQAAAVNAAVQLSSGDILCFLDADHPWPFPMASAIAVRRSAWDAAGDIPEQFRMSADAWLTGIYPFLGGVAALPDSLGFYRIHNNNWYRPIDDAAMLRKRMAHWQADR